MITETQNGIKNILKIVNYTKLNNLISIYLYRFIRLNNYSEKSCLHLNKITLHQLKPDSWHRTCRTISQVGVAENRGLLT